MKSLFVALGAGVYWADMTLRLLVTGPYLVSETIQSILAVTLALGLLAASPYLTGRHLLGLSAVALVFNLLNLGLAVVPAEVLSAVQGSPLSCLLAVPYLGSPLLMLLWGVRFAGLSRMEAFAEVGKTSLVALAVHCLVVAVAALVPAADSGALTVVGPALCSVSACLMVAVCVRYPIRTEAREFNRDARGPMVFFVVSRGLLGLLMGCLLAMTPIATGEGEPGWTATPAALVCIACALLVAVPKTRRLMQSWVPLVPLAAGTLLPALVLPDLSFGWAFLYAAVWFAWIVMSSVQLSELKYTFGMSELSLAFFEKTLMVFAMLMGATLTRFLGISTVDCRLEEGLAQYAPFFVLVVAACLYSSATLLGLSNMRSHERIVREVVAEQDDELGYIYQTVAAEHALSEREAEILRYLAKGHTRSYISNSLNIAPGTVKSHIGHIYRKLGCHTKEDVIALVNARKEFRE